MSKIEIKKSNIPGAGNGVFATEFIEEGEIIETPEYIYITENFAEAAGIKTILDSYKYKMIENYLTLLDGKTSFINHGMKGNVDPYNFKENYSVTIAIRDINKGEELLYDYGASYIYKNFPRYRST